MDYKTYSKIIKIYSIIGIVMGAIVSILGLVLLLAGGSGLKDNPVIASLGILLILVAILLIALGLFEIVLYICLWMGKNWTRWLIVLSGGMSLMFYRNWFAMIFEIIFYGFLIYILFIDRNSKKYFGRKR